jgi:hypothetical protein
MPACLAQHFRMAAEADRMAFDPAQQVLGQDQWLTLNTWKMVKVHRQPPVTIFVNRENMTAKRLAVTNAARKESEKILSLLTIRSRGLDDNPAQ